MNGIALESPTQVALAGQDVVGGVWARLAELEPWLEARQMEVTSVPAPTGAEGRRAAWMRQALVELGWSAEIDDAGNVLACRPGQDGLAPAVLVSAHLDTAFPNLQTIEPERREGRLYAPGIGDNGAGLAALLAVARLVGESGLKTRAAIVLAANVGEEGEGDLCGMWHLFRSSPWRDRIGPTLVVDGPGSDHIINQGLASRRLKIALQGPGGHSWSNAGTASAVHAAARIAARLLAELRMQPGQSSWNVGCMEGGHVVNAVAADATLKIDLRAVDPQVLEAMAECVQRSAVAGVEQENAAALHGTVQAQVTCIGARPAGRLADASPLLAVVRAIDARLGLAGQLQCASTDANVPLALGREAVCLGGGGSGGGAHTRGEWYDPRHRAVGLQRLLWAVLTLAGAHSGL